MTCAIYCRLSKEDENTLQESESIQNQKNLLVNHAVQQEWDIYNIYCDDDYSGADQDRPEWNDMLRAAQAGKFQVVLCKTQSRFTRDMEMVEKYLHGLFPLWGIRFVALIDNVDTNVKGNKKARQINGLINEWYLEDLSENVKAVLDQKRQSGKFIGSFPTYGYQKDPDDHNHLVIDEEAAEVVRQIFEMYLSGMGTHVIAHTLNQKGILNPSRYKQSKYPGYVNGSEKTLNGYWNRTSVSRILHNEVYIGNLVQGTKRKASYKSKKLLDVPKSQWARVEGTHEPIIEQDVFEAAQRRVRKHTRSDGKGEAHILSGRLFCADCGSSMMKVSYVYKETRRFYLQCTRYAHTRQAPQCTRHSVRLDRLMDVVDSQVKEHVGCFYELGDTERFRVEDNTARRIEAIHQEIAAANQRMERISTTVRDLYMDKVDGTISKEQFLELNDGYLAEKDRLGQQVATLHARLEELGHRKVDNAKLEARVLELLELNHMGRELYDLLIDKVEVGEVNPESKMQGIHINWKI